MAKKEGQETIGTFVGKLMTFRGDEDDPTFDRAIVIEVAETKPEVEIMWNEGKVRRYLRFRLEDLQRAIKEMS